MVKNNPKLPLFPSTTTVNKQGHLVVGGCDTIELAASFGTPLYIFDEFGLRSKCREFKTAFGQRYPRTTVIYASKAFINQALLRIFNEEGLGLDVVSAGELGIAHAADFPLAKAYFHGNNKSAEELDLALKWHVGRIVVDNFHELKMLDELAGQQGYQPDILLRLSPGVDPHTHKYNTTGIIDSKFGFPITSHEDAVVQAMAAPHLNLVGLHFHIGSLIFEIEPYREAIKIILDFAARMKQKHGFETRELDIGGGFAVQYSLDTPARPISDYAEVIVSTITSECQRLKLTLPGLVIEPGRSIVGRSGLALYKAGVVKEIPGVRCYVSVDGGMADNIRLALYGAKHEAITANKVYEQETKIVTIAGKFCESGDILVRDVSLPPVSAGDIIALADTGAYCLSMGSNYNASFKPAVVLVSEGTARLIRRRETVEDLLRCDIV